MTVDLTVMTLTLNLVQAMSRKIYYVGSCYMVGIVVGGLKSAMSWCDLDGTFNLGSVRMLLPHLRHISPITKPYRLLQVMLVADMSYTYLKCSWQKKKTVNFQSGQIQASQGNLLKRF